MRMKNKNTKKYLKNKSNKKKKRGRKNNKYKRNMVLDFFQVFYEERPLLRKHRNIFESINSRRISSKERVEYKNIFKVGLNLCMYSNIFKVQN